ncbi:ATP-binding domain protein, partial [Escherichia coli 5412]
MTEKSIYLSSWALTEPDDIFYFYQPTWLNAWEAHMYERGLYGTRANGWGLKRFGVENDIYAPERIRNPQYMPYLEAMEQVTDSALQQMPTKERVDSIGQRNSYVKTWGCGGFLNETNI